MRLHRNGSATRSRRQRRLTGLIYDDQGERLVPTHANKKGTRYRYYVSQPLVKGGRTKGCKRGRRLPAGDLECLVEHRLTGFLGNAADVFGVIEEAITDVDERKMVIERAAALAKDWTGLTPHRKKALLQALVDRI